MARSRFYVGMKKGGASEVFKSVRTPTHSSHGHRFYGVIGPFVTKAGAEVMARYGHNNPHLVTVADAEKMAHRLRKERAR